MSFRACYEAETMVCVFRETKSEPERIVRVFEDTKVDEMVLCVFSFKQQTKKGSVTDSSHPDAKRNRLGNGLVSFAKSENL